MTLTAINLTCSRGGAVLFDPVSFVLQPGHARLVQGRNGVGKTTMLRAIAGLGQRPQGHVTLDQKPVWEMDGAMLYTGHLDAVKPTLTVAENLSFWSDLASRGPLADALEAFNLTILRDRLAGRLSAGQKRRLGLARLAVSTAPVWLLDEPTMSLDQDSTALLGAVVARHLAGGGYALIATHVPIPVTAEPLALTAMTSGPTMDPFLTGAID